MARFTEFDQLPTTPEWGVQDWQQMLGFSTEEDRKPVRLGQIYKVEAMWSNPGLGDCSEADYAALIELWDGTWATLHAGCDTTGWGCDGDYVDWRIFDTRTEAVRNGLTNESRRWLNVELPGASDA